MTNEQSNKNRRTTKEINQERQEQRKKKFRVRLIISIILVGIIGVISLLIYWNVSHKSEKGQINDLDKAIRNGNADKVSEIVKTKGSNLPKQDANRMINYLTQEQNISRYKKQIRKIKNTVDNKTNESTIGELTDKRGKPILTISRDGVRAFIFKNLAFTPHYRDVYIDGKNNDATYQFKNKGKKFNAVSSNKVTKLGSFMVGNYNMSAEKHFKNNQLDIDDSVSGVIHINTDDANSKGQIVADEDFPQTWFRVELKNKSKLDDDYNLYINDNRISYSPTKIYGKYPTEYPIKVKATGRMNNKTIKTNEVKVESNQKDATQTITLKFDDKSIKKQLKKDNDIKKDTQKFLKDYTEELSKGYENSSFTGLKKYFEDSNSDVAKNIKKQVESDKDNQYSEPKFKSYKKKGNEIDIILTKKEDKDRTIMSRYTLVYDSDSSHKFQIKEYTDI